MALGKGIIPLHNSGPHHHRPTSPPLSPPGRAQEAVMEMKRKKEREAGLTERGREQNGGEEEAEGGSQRRGEISQKGGNRRKQKGP